MAVNDQPPGMIAGMAQEQYVDYIQRWDHVETQRRAQYEQRRDKDQCRTLVRTLVDLTGKCDGTSPAAIRTWLEEIELIIPQAEGNQGNRDTLLEVVTRTVTGSLRKEIERYIRQQAERHHVERLRVPWIDVKNHVRQSFLSVNEDKHLKDEVRQIKQSPYETIASFNRRFRDSADGAYPIAGRNEDQQRILLEAYARGLRDDDMVREIIKKGKPASMDEAMILASDFENGEDEYQRLKRGERAMEIAATNTIKPMSDGRSDELLERVKKIAINQERLQTRLAKMEIQNQQPSRTKRPDNLITCFQCGRQGHKARDCRRNNYRAPDRSAPSRRQDYRRTAPAPNRFQQNSGN